MTLITFTSDFGTRDYYVGLLKGCMLSRYRDLQFVDITHDIDNYDIVQAAFTVRNVWRAFPEGTIHLVSVNDFSSKRARFITFSVEGHHFVGPDNGVFSLIFQELPTPIYEIAYNEDASFPLQEVFANAIAHYTGEGSTQPIGLPVHGITERISLQPVVTASQIRGSVIHIDTYHNAVLNITRDTFERVRQGRPFALYYRRHDPITRLSTRYHDVPVGEMLCRFNSADCLEIAINMGNASELLGLEADDTVQVDFYEASPRR